MKGNGYKPRPRGCTGGWVKIPENPVLGGPLGTCFDVAVLKEDGKYKMWFSWRPVRLIAYTESDDGIHWDAATVALTALPSSDWEKHEVNRPTVVKKDGVYHMWYCGQVFPSEFTRSYTAIGYATSIDGVHWDRRPEPVMRPELPWEKYTLLCPHVIWDEKMGLFRMWYSGGEQYEADAIGYATSADGISWTRHPGNPVFKPDPDNFWDMSKVEACYVWKRDGWHYMFYLGMDGDLIAAAGLARSRDGITGWERHPDNPIIAGDDGTWDHMGICKVSVLEEDDGYRIWFNGAGRFLEELGVATHKGFDLWPENTENYVPERGENSFKGVESFRF